jgi:hypothetical protein
MWSILIGAVFIIGGASGQMALKGTQSGGALAAVGAVLVAFGIFQLVRSSKQGGTGRQAGRPRTARNIRRR